MRKLLKAEEAAAVVGLSAYELRRGAKQGRYPFINAGNRVLFDVEAVNRAIDEEMEINRKRARRDYEKSGGGQW